MKGDLQGTDSAEEIASTNATPNKLTMETVIREVSKHVQYLWERLEGPFSFRIIIQPLVAVALAVRAGVRDARSGRPPHGWAIITDSVNRSRLLLESWKDISKVFVVAVIIDILYEIIALPRIFPVQSLIVAATLALIPYLLIRGPANRIARRFLN